ncbi:MAG TPA: hypothetical protein VEG68_10440 [Terriglobales bacterium]|nr:hypothetical protein [Terriglobales bacterium]
MLVSRYDDSDLSRLLLEISLLESAYRNGSDPDSDILLTTAKRYRIDAEKLQKAVAQEFAAKKKTVPINTLRFFREPSISMNSRPNPKHKKR